MAHSRTRLGWATVFVGYLGIAGVPVAAQQSVTPINGGKVTSPIVVITHQPGNQGEPRIDRDLMSYSDFGTAPGPKPIRYFRFSTGVDAAVPAGLPGEGDLLADVNGNRIAFSRIKLDGTTAIFLFNTETSSLTEIAPQAGAQRFNPALGGNTLAFADAAVANGLIFVYDLGANPPAAPVSLDTSTANEDLPDVAPDGKTVVWQACVPHNCDIFKAVRADDKWMVSPVADTPFVEEGPHTDGKWIVYDATRTGASQVYFQEVRGGPEIRLNLPGSQIFTHISRGFVSFSNRKSFDDRADIYVYDIVHNTLYQITDTPLGDELTSDLSVLENGDVRVVWVGLDAAKPPFEFSIFATTFTPVAGDFSLGGIAPMTIAAGGSASASVTVTPLNGFSSAVNLSASGQPAGATATVWPNSVTPSAGNPASSVLSLSAASFVVPTNFALTVTGASKSLNHSATANVSVTVTATSTINAIGDMLTMGCIDSAGVGSALTSKLLAAQSAGDVQTAINTLTTLKNQIQAQASKHIHMACTIGGVAFNPVNVLLLDVQALIDNLRVTQMDQSQKASLGSGLRS